MTEKNETSESSIDATFGHSFDEMTKPYLYELHIHCYRMLGSVEDAEDAVQETLLGAWKHLNRLQTPSALRAWLYKIATNKCLDMLKSRKIRILPETSYPPANPIDELLPANIEDAWLDPLPETYLAEYRLEPEQHHAVQEKVTLAFLTVLQQLPGRQRAVVLLRDVLELKAREVADILDMSVVAVNSALQRARATLKKHETDLSSDDVAIDDATISNLLERYVQAWENVDLASLMTLIHADAKLTMPPLPVWYQGRKHIQIFLERYVFADRQAGDYHVSFTYANGKPAIVVYHKGVQGYQFVSFNILTIQDGKIVHMNHFLDLSPALLSHLKTPIF